MERDEVGRVELLDIDPDMMAQARYAALRRGGVLVNADVNMLNYGAERDALYRRWADHLVVSGISEERAWAHCEEWAQEDTICHWRTS